MKPLLGARFDLGLPPIERGFERSQDDEIRAAT
jgi:hypothetical protein